MKTGSFSKAMVPGLLALAFLGPVALVVGCGGDSSNVGGGFNSNVGGSGTANQAQSVAVVQGVVPRGTPGGGNAVTCAPLEMNPIETALSWVSRPALAQNSPVALAGFLATAFDARGQAVATVPCDATGSVKFTGLPPGIYRVLFFNTNFPTTFVQTLINIPGNGATVNARANETTSAAVMILLKLAGSLDFSRLDSLAIFNNAQTTPGFGNVVNTLRNLLVSGLPNFNQGNGGSLDPQLASAVTAVAGSVDPGNGTGGTTTGGTTTGGTSTGGTGGTSTGGTGGTSTGGTSTGGTGGTSTGGTGGTSTGGTSTGVP